MITARLFMSVIGTPSISSCCREPVPRRWRSSNSQIDPACAQTRGGPRGASDKRPAPLVFRKYEAFMFILSSALPRCLGGGHAHRSPSTEGMAEDSCHDLLGVKMGFGDLPGSLAMPPIVSVDSVKRISGFLKS